MDSYEQDMLEKFQIEGLKQLLKEHFQMSPEQAHDRSYDNEVDFIAKDLIKYKGNLVNYYTERFGVCNNFMFVELAEVYNKWKSESKSTEG